MTTFDPNAACAPNGRFFGFPYRTEEAGLVLIPVPWDVTTSYKPGAADGPQSILNASYQLDFFDFFVPQAWTKRIATEKPDFAELRDTSRKMRPIAEKVIERAATASEAACEAACEAAAGAHHAAGLDGDSGDGLDGAAHSLRADRDLMKIEAASETLNDWVAEQCRTQLKAGRKVGLVGGDHSVPYGHWLALADFHDNWGILHIDAHADLRQAYEGFTFSHASIMYNALQLRNAAGRPPVSALVQVGIRDVCEEEMQRAAADKRVHTFPDPLLQKARCEGVSWARQVEDILACLPQKVYISFDIDGLEPALCPHTGTPVPGGLRYGEMQYLLEALRRSGREIIGFDLCEVAPHPTDKADEWDGNVGARVLYQLCLTALS